MRGSKFVIKNNISDDIKRNILQQVQAGENLMIIAKRNRVSPNIIRTLYKYDKPNKNVTKIKKEDTEMSKEITRRPKLTMEDRRIILKQIRSGVKRGEIAKEFNIDPTVIDRIRRGGDTNPDYTYTTWADLTIDEKRELMRRVKNKELSLNQLTCSWFVDYNKFYKEYDQYLNEINAIDFSNFAHFNLFNDYDIITRSRKQPKTKKAQISMYDEVYSALSVISNNTGISMNDIVSAAIVKMYSDYINNRERQ